MGIRFYCPNGHKLNVKEFQAGRRGICPYCGVKIQIPTESTRKPSKRTEGKSASHDAAVTILPAADANVSADVPIDTQSPVAKGSVPLQPVTHSSTVASPTGFQASEPRISVPQTPVSPAPVSPAPVSPAPVPQTPVPSSHPDPLAEAGDAAWYVRPASGGQFGPAAGHVMRAWIGEGRVDSDSLVWRDGWQDWQEAGEVFPQLGGTQKPEQEPAFAQIAPSGTNATRAAAARISRVRARRQGRNIQTIVTILLVFAVIALGAVFVFVVSP